MVASGRSFSWPSALYVSINFCFLLNPFHDAFEGMHKKEGWWLWWEISLLSPWLKFEGPNARFESSKFSNFKLVGQIKFQFLKWWEDQLPLIPSHIKYFFKLGGCSMTTCTRRVGRWSKKCHFCPLSGLQMSTWRWLVVKKRAKLRPRSHWMSP